MSNDHEEPEIEFGPGFQVPLPEPTDTHPGSEEKMEVISQRYHSGQALWHPDDNNEVRHEPGNKRRSREEDVEEDFGDGVFDDEVIE